MPSSAVRFPLLPSEMCLGLAKSVPHPLLSDSYAHAARDELPSTPRGSSVWQVPLGERGTRCASGGHAWRDASRPAARPRSSGRPEREEKGPARTAGLNCASLTALTRHVFRRASGTSSGVQPARLAARNRRVSRRATGASCGAQSARLAARIRHVSAACSLRRPAHRRAQGRAI